MKPTIIRLTFWILPVLFCQCAGVRHHAILSSEADLKDKGIRYYDTSPYILVATDNEGGLSSEFVYLPDLTKKRSAKPFAFLATNNTELTWDESGTALLGSKSDVDTGKVPVAIIGALQSAAEAYLKKSFLEPASDTDPDRTAPTAYLFKVVKRNGQWGLTGAETTPAPRY